MPLGAAGPRAMKGQQMAHQSRLLVGGLAAALLVGGSWAVASAQEDQPTAPTPTTSVVSDPLSQEAIAADWCDTVSPLVGPGGALAPSVRAVVESMVSRDATPTQEGRPLTAPDPDAGESTAFLALVEGEPDAVASAFAEVRAAAHLAVAGRTLTDPAGALAAADVLDRYLADTCRSAG
jgi:hypothetical protein